jgi:hypothetical protein
MKNIKYFKGFLETAALFALAFVYWWCWFRITDWILSLIY